MIQIKSTETFATVFKVMQALNLNLEVRHA